MMLTIPIMIPKTDEIREMYLRDLQLCEAEHVLIDSLEFFADGQEREDHLALLKKNIAYYKEAGIHPAIWTNTLGWGSERSQTFQKKFSDTTRITSFAGVSGHAVCPLDEAFTAQMEQNMEDYARTGADLILLDDDLVLSVRPGFSCACALHLEEFARRTGRTWTGKEVEALFTGAPSEYRTAWMDLTGESLMNFCRRLRAAVDRVDPTVRIGLCASYTHYDMDGFDMKALLSVLAGEGNRPFMRLSGAPYWACIAPRFPGQRLSGIAEFVRMQSAWLADTEIELIDENDSYPRDGQIPAKICELYDKVMLTQSRVGRLKYILYYGENRDGEMSYLQAHLDNKPHDPKIREFFAGKTPVGLRVFCAEHKIRTADLPDTYLGDYPLLQMYAMPYAGSLVALHGIPTKYTGDGPTVVFGEDARYLPDALSGQTILADHTAAVILNERGIACTELDVDTYTVDFTKIPDLLVWLKAAVPALPTVSDGIYLLASENDSRDELALMLINDQASDAEAVVVTLHGSYVISDTINCTAKIDGDQLLIGKLASFDFASVLLKKVSFQ